MKDKKMHMKEIINQQKNIWHPQKPGIIFKYKDSPYAIFHANFFFFLVSQTYYNGHINEFQDQGHYLN